MKLFLVVAACCILQEGSGTVQKPAAYYRKIPEQSESLLHIAGRFRNSPKTCCMLQESSGTVRKLAAGCGSHFTPGGDLFSIKQVVNGPFCARKQVFVWGVSGIYTVIYTAWAIKP